MVSQDVECLAGESKCRASCTGRDRPRNQRVYESGTSVFLGTEPIKGLSTPAGTLGVVERWSVLGWCRVSAGLGGGDRGAEAILGLQIVGQCGLGLERLAVEPHRGREPAGHPAELGDIEAAVGVGRYVLAVQDLFEPPLHRRQTFGMMQVGLDLAGD